MDLVRIARPELREWLWQVLRVVQIRPSPRGSETRATIVLMGKDDRTLEIGLSGIEVARLGRRLRVMIVPALV